jgi:hypothetical protein
MSFLPIRITREQWVEESVNVVVPTCLAARGYPPGSYEILDAYPYTPLKLDNTKIACGFTFDDGGKNFEMGSNLKERKYTIEFFVFGPTLTEAKSFANAIKFSMENDQVIPLLDVTQVPPAATGEFLEVDSCHSRRQPIPDPEPWQEFTWLVVVQVTDYYTPALT